MSSTPSAARASNTPGPSRAGFRALLILIVVTVFVAVGAGIYLFTRPSYAGTWVGPGNLQNGDNAVPLVTLLSLQQNLLGGISGTGSICAKIGTTTQQIPVSVEGGISGTSASLTLFNTGGNALSSINSIRGTASLDQGQLTLTASQPVHMLLELGKGSRSDYDSGCSALGSSGG